MVTPLNTQGRPVELLARNMTMAGSSDPAIVSPGIPRLLLERLDPTDRSALPHG
jgi:hypothetical protein